MDIYIIAPTIFKQVFPEDGRRQKVRTTFVADHCPKPEIQLRAF